MKGNTKTSNTLIASDSEENKFGQERSNRKDEREGGSNRELQGKGINQLRFFRIITPALTVLSVRS